MTDTADANEAPDAARISIRGLYKIFGDAPGRALERVLDGCGKEALLSETGHVLALENINLDIAARRFFVVMGLSGSGKSTLIRHINRLIEPTAGEVVIDGTDILALSERDLEHFRQTKTSMVFQRFALLPHRTIRDNVGYGLTIQRLPADQVQARAGEWIERVGLGGYETQYPHQLSGGMQQRVGLARALATDAEILLMDEPFSALDPLIRNDMQDLLLQLQGDLHKTIVFITHDLDEALKLADTLAVLKDGRVVQSGDPQDVILRPADDYVAAFVKDINRARVVRLRSVLRAASPGAAPLATLSPHDTLQALLVAIGDDPDPDAVVAIADAGAPVGEVLVRDALRALTPPE